MLLSTVAHKLNIKTRKGKDRMTFSSSLRHLYSLVASPSSTPSFSSSPSATLSFSVMYSPFWYLRFLQRFLFFIEEVSPPSVGLSLSASTSSGRGLIRGLPRGRRTGTGGGGVGGGVDGGSRGGGVGGVAKLQSRSNTSSVRLRPRLSRGEASSWESDSLLGQPGLLRELESLSTWGLLHGPFSESVTGDRIQNYPWETFGKPFHCLTWQKQKHLTQKCQIGHYLLFCHFKPVFWYIVVKSFTQVFSIQVCSDHSC